MLPTAIPCCLTFPIFINFVVYLFTKVHERRKMMAILWQLAMRTESFLVNMSLPCFCVPIQASVSNPLLAALFTRPCLRQCGECHDSRRSCCAMGSHSLGREISPCERKKLKILETECPAPPPLTCCVARAKLADLSVPQVPHL